MIFDFFKDEPILTTIWSIVKWIGNIFWKVLDFDIKVWWIIIAFSFLALVLFLIDKLRKDVMKQPEYKEDTIKGWKWSWSWKFNTSGNAWVLSDLKAHCPKCNTPMIEQSFINQAHFECPRCDFHSSDRSSDESYKIQSIIIDNIKRVKNNPYTSYTA